MVARKLVDSAADSDKSSSAIGKAFAVIRAMRKTLGPMTLTAIADEIGLAPSSAHSILTQLLEQGVVVQDSDKRYQFGPAIFYLGSAFARATPIYRSVWMELVTAANQHGVTAAVAVPWENHHLVLNAHRGGDSDVAVPFGGRVPIDAASWGKVYYAWSGEPVPAKLGRYTALSVGSKAELTKEIELVSELGYACDRGEFSDGVGGVCAAVTSSNGYEGLASFLAPLARIEQISYEILGRHLASMTARASRALGDPARMRFFGSE
jgi:DNA-binding IclR family transcriptional regulator